MSVPPRRPAAGVLVRIVMSLLVLVHLGASATNYFRDTEPAKKVRKHTRKYEQLIGLSQNWDMFAPNPPRSVIYLETEALTPEGDWVPVPRITDNQDGPIRTRYWRGGKEERYLFTDEKKGLRRRKTKRICARYAEAGTPIEEVRYRRAWLRIPRPHHAREGRPYEPNGKDLEDYPCPRR